MGDGKQSKDTSKPWMTEEEKLEQFKFRVGMLPLEFEEKISTLDKPLIIENACPGGQLKWWPPVEAYGMRGRPPKYEEGGVRFPAVPITLEDQVKSAIEATKAGAGALHFHTRDPHTGLSLSHFSDERLPIEIKNLDKVFAEVDAVTLQHTWAAKQDALEGLWSGIDYITNTKKLLEIGKGNKYCQGIVVLWPPCDYYPRGYEDSVVEATRFLEKNKVKAIHKFRSTYNARKFKRTLVDTGVIKEKPYVLVHDMGHPYGWPLDIDPWMPIDMIASIEQTKQRIPDSIIGVYSGGRNWLPITLTAILAGVDLVRVGIEDCYWMYPHKDEVIQNNLDCIKKIVDFCRIIGRKVANAAQARDILGIELT